MLWQSSNIIVQASNKHVKDTTERDLKLSTCCATFISSAVCRHSPEYITTEYSYLLYALMQAHGYLESLAQPDGPGSLQGSPPPHFGGPSMHTPSLERSLNTEKVTDLAYASSSSLRYLRELFRWCVDRGVSQGHYFAS
jgi:hypothetical protein